MCGNHSNVLLSSTSIPYDKSQTYVPIFRADKQKDRRRPHYFRLEMGQKLDMSIVDTDTVFLR